MNKNKATVTVYSDCKDVITTGLTKREMFALHAMQGYLAMCAGAEKYPNDGEVAYEAVTIADALLSELESQDVY